MFFLSNLQALTGKTRGVREKMHLQHAERLMSHSSQSISLKNLKQSLLIDIHDHLEAFHVMLFSLKKLKE